MLAMSSTVVARTFCALNALSMINCIVVFCLFGPFLRDGGWLMWGMAGIPLALIFLKIYLAYVVLKYLPHLDYERDMIISQLDIGRSSQKREKKDQDTVNKVALN